MIMPAMNTLSLRTSVTLGVSTGIALLGIVAVYLRRRRGNSNKDTPTPSLRPVIQKTPNGDVSHINAYSTTSSPSQHHRRRRTRTTSRSSSVMSSQVTVTNESVSTAEMDPQQLCQRGLEYLHKAVEMWEDAYSKTHSMTVESQSGSASQADENENEKSTLELKSQIRALLKKAYGMEDEHRHLIEHHLNNVVFDRALTASIEEMNVYDKEIEDDADSDLESFVSAPEFAEMTEKEEIQLARDHPLYHSGVLEVKHGSVPHRKIRTEILHCANDADFLAKLHCVRLAFQQLFQDSTIKEWFIQKGKEMITNIITKAQKDPSDFMSTYDSMIRYISDSNTQQQMTSELKDRGVQCISFYDVAMDFIFMDAFVEMDNPPSSVMTVVNNQWLSNGFKETALSTAVWSVLKAKRRMLKYQDGFMSHFYTLSETVSPLLVWGFLGPVEQLNNICDSFKDHILQFMEDVFNMDRVRYTSIEQLADDIYGVAREHEMALSQCFEITQ